MRDALKLWLLHEPLAQMKPDFAMSAITLLDLTMVARFISALRKSL